VAAHGLHQDCLLQLRAIRPGICLYAEPRQNIGKNPSNSENRENVIDSRQNKGRQLKSGFLTPKSGGGFNSVLR
jgi:hypothetical protein